MGLITDLTRMYLTHSTKPFIFTKDFDKVLPYDNGSEFGLYVHIPFCKSICNFCPYCKVIYDEETAKGYIDALIKEIHLVGRQWNGRRKATSLFKDQFKINTFSVLEYCKRIDANILPTALTNRFVKRKRMIYYLFWKLLF